MNFQVLLYHGVYLHRDEIRGKPLREHLSQQILRNQIRWLKERGCTLLTLKECHERAMGHDLPPKVVCLTFDDGKESHLSLVAPILAEEGIQGTFYIIPDWLGRPNLLKPDGVRRLVRMGMEIGSHSLSHRLMTALPPEEMAREAAESKRVLEDLVSAPVVSFSYPHGDCDSRVREAVARAGFQIACGARRGANSSSSDWLMLNRWGMRERAGLESLQRILDRGEPSFMEWSADWVKKSMGMGRYVRWRKRLLRKTGE